MRRMRTITTTIISIIIIVRSIIAIERIVIIIVMSSTSPGLYARPWSLTFEDLAYDGYAFADETRTRFRV